MICELCCKENKYLFECRVSGKLFGVCCLDYILFEGTIGYYVSNKLT